MRKLYQSIFKGLPRWKTSGVEWSNFTLAVEEATNSAPATTNVHILSRFLEKEIVAAAKVHVGTTIPGKTKKPWMTPVVREAIRERNKLRKNISQNREEWVAACRSTSEIIREAKTAEWRKTLDKPP